MIFTFIFREKHANVHSLNGRRISMKFGIQNKSKNRIFYFMGGSPGLVVTGGDSCSKGYEFKSWHSILDGHFFTVICCKNCYVCLKKLKMNEKEAGDGPFFFKKMFYFSLFNILLWRTPVFQETKATLMRSSLQRLQIGTR